MTHRGGNRSHPPPPPPSFALAACPMQPPALPPRPFSTSRASLHHVLPLYHTRGADVDMRLRHAYAAAFGIGLRAANHRRET